MKNNIKKIIVIALIIIITATIISLNLIEKNEISPIEKLKKDLGVVGDDELYEIATEYDGTKNLSIKPNIEYNVALAGAINGDIVKMEEVDKIIANVPNKNGIWVESSSRNTLINMIKDVSNNYEINSEGYLVRINENIAKNKYEEKIDSKINGNMLYILAIREFYLMVDNVTGEIGKFPYENIDPYQVNEQFIDGNKTLEIITTNKEKNYKNREIIDEIF